MNKLSIQDRVQILNALSEGVGITAMRNLTIKKVQVDEIWSFVGMKQKNAPIENPAGYGDCYTFTAIDPETKLMLCWSVRARRNAPMTSWKIWPVAWPIGCGRPGRLS